MKEGEYVFTTVVDQGCGSESVGNIACEGRPEVCAESRTGRLRQNSRNVVVRNSGTGVEKES